MSRKIWMVKVVLLAISLAISPVYAQEDDAGRKDKQEVEEVVVEAARPLTAYSDQVVRDKDFLNLPRQNPSDLIRMVPGIHINQHTGGGKAHQYFLRGFDAEHGQDLAGYFGGVPLNEVSHVHGQGYLDLFFLIPETLGRMHMIKGPYDPRYGNFAVAGAVDFVPKELPEHNRLEIAGGSFDYRRYMAQSGFRAAGASFHLAADYETTDGFTDPGDFRAGRGFFQVTRPFGSSTLLKFMAACYDSEYDAADVAPVKWIALDRMERYEAIDETDGGESYRSIFAATLEHNTEKLSTGGRAYFQDRSSTIWSNYTYYLLHPQKGDQYELDDDRIYYGLDMWASLRYELFGLSAETEAGVNTRRDRVEQHQLNTDDREPFNTLTDYDFTESSVGAYLKQLVWPARWLQVMGGVRYDRVLYDIEGTRDVYNGAIWLEEQPADTRTWADVVAPKSSIVISPVDRKKGTVSSLDLFANYGIGFYSKRAPLMATPPSGHDIPRARMWEFATKAGFWSDRVTIAGGWWFADKEEELVFQPEAGYSAPQGESRREGQDLELRIEPADWIYLATNFHHTEAEFTDTGEDIPGTPELLFTQVVSARRRSGWRGAVRYRWEGPRPLLNDDQSRAYHVVDVLGAYETEHWGAELSVENLFDVEWDDTSFSYTSRPSPGGPTYTGLHITPGTPLAAKLSVFAKF